MERLALKAIKHKDMNKTQPLPLCIAEKTSEEEMVKLESRL